MERQRGETGATEGRKESFKPNFEKLKSPKSIQVSECLIQDTYTFSIPIKKKRKHINAHVEIPGWP